MHCVYHTRRTLSAERYESQGWVAAELDDQDMPGRDRIDAGERHLGDAVTRAEVMEYLSQRYGAVFVADLASHLSEPDDAGIRILVGASAR